MNIAIRDNAAIHKHLIFKKFNLFRSLKTDTRWTDLHILTFVNKNSYEMGSESFQQYGAFFVKNFSKKLRVGLVTGVPNFT